MYSDTLRQQAVKLYADGLGYRQIARHLRVDHVTIMNGVKAHIDQLPQAPLPTDARLHVVEMDELYTFIGHKKPSLPRDLGGSSHQLHCRLAGDEGARYHDLTNFARQHAGGNLVFQRPVGNLQNLDLYTWNPYSHAEQK
jgi:transposase-like protein